VNKEKIVIISAPSGTGKGTVIKRILEITTRVQLSVSCTTRLPRENETEGVDYYFISKEMFADMIAHDKFLEHAEYSGNCYGTPLEPLDRNTDAGIIMILEIDVKGFLQVKRLIPEALSVFMVPPSMEELERRLRGRGSETEESICKRLAAASQEIPMASQFDYTVVSDTIDHTANEIISIIKKHTGVKEL